jgi:hypothetical protein
MTYIDKPGVALADECPPVYYGDAFMQFLIVVWQMRLTRPVKIYFSIVTISMQRFGGSYIIRI